MIEPTEEEKNLGKVLDNLDAISERLENVVEVIETGAQDIVRAIEYLAGRLGK